MDFAAAGRSNNYGPTNISGRATAVLGNKYGDVFNIKQATIHLVSTSPVESNDRVRTVVRHNKVLPGGQQTLETVTTYDDGDVLTQKGSSQLVEVLWQRCERLGSGTFGKVYREETTEVGRLKSRAVKVLHRDWLEHMQIDYKKELSALIQLSQPIYVHRFVDFYSWYEDLSHIYLAMEFIPHRDLAGYIREGLKESDAREIASQVLDGIRIMHHLDLVHRDIKPANILVVQPQPHWVVKIADFSICKSTITRHTNVRTQVGSEGYIAPEVLGLASTEKLDLYNAKCDIWSFGCMLFEILTGQLPFSNLGSLSRYCTNDAPFPGELIKKAGSGLLIAQFTWTMLQAEPQHRPTADQSMFLLYHRCESSAFLQRDPDELPHLYLTDCIGRVFRVPWQSCSTWAAIQSTIRLALSYLEINDIGAKLARGDFELVNTDQQIISPENWEAMVKPGIQIMIKLLSQQPNEALQTEADVGSRDFADCVSLESGHQPRPLNSPDLTSVGVDYGSNSSDSYESHGKSLDNDLDISSPACYSLRRLHEQCAQPVSDQNYDEIDPSDPSGTLDWDDVPQTRSGPPRLYHFLKCCQCGSYQEGYELVHCLNQKCQHRYGCCCTIGLLEPPTQHRDKPVSMAMESPQRGHSPSRGFLMDTWDTDSHISIEPLSLKPSRDRDKVIKAEAKSEGPSEVKDVLRPKRTVQPYKKRKSSVKVSNDPPATKSKPLSFLFDAFRSERSRPPVQVRKKPTPKPLNESERRTMEVHRKQRDNRDRARERERESQRRFAYTEEASDISSSSEELSIPTRGRRLTPAKRDTSPVLRISSPRPHARGRKETSSEVMQDLDHGTPPHDSGSKSIADNAPVGSPLDQSPPRRTNIPSSPRPERRPSYSRNERGSSYGGREHVVRGEKPSVPGIVLTGTDTSRAFMAGGHPRYSEPGAEYQMGRRSDQFTSRKSYDGPREPPSDRRSSPLPSKQARVDKRSWFNS